MGRVSFPFGEIKHLGWCSIEMRKKLIEKGAPRYYPIACDSWVAGQGDDELVTFSWPDNITEEEDEKWRRGREWR